MHCTLKFQGPPKHVANMQKLIVPVTNKPSSTDHDSKTTIGGEQHTKMRKTESDIVDVDSVVLTCVTIIKPWLTLNGIQLTEADKADIIKGAELNNKHMDFAQEIIRMQLKNLATCTALAHCSQPGRYDQKMMRGHLLKCFENLVLPVFLC